MDQKRPDGPQQLASLDEKAFAAKWEDGKVIKSRITEPSTVAAISSILTSPIKDGDFDSLNLHQLVIYAVLLHLPFEQLQPYRPALETLSAFDISNFVADGSHKAQSAHVIGNSGLLARFAADPEVVWVTDSKFDCVSDRTLTERVHSAEQMRPYMPALCSWLADANNPPYSPCRAQLARFPEAATAVVAEEMTKAGEENDIWFQEGLLDFVSSCVPVGEAWIPMRAPVQAMVQALEKCDRDDAYDELIDDAKEWLAKLEEWEAHPTV
ncbi:hypothetical protein B0I35DRAFT_448789 [Stachybotrys elegans]|uniref:DUF5071 domain-containing protein n=1 Tax=Stachybotrys elegans TaxID=80388 RepID=A0A8K0T268_9HYPO|nr:hypothetical protein B0I35DRAFT_448789 [Stachybotrys elegans]